MIPLKQAYEVKEAIGEYLKATFTFRDNKLNEAFHSFLYHKHNGLFKGPYISLKLPFIKADKDTIIPLDIKPSFTPYKHQLTSFERLTTHNEHNPQPTLLTTGTGSGKTESFLFPLLDYCYQHANKRGIKVIILYPMNALATDQARRIAKIIDSDDRLKGKITAGLFIGEGGNNKSEKTKKKFPMEMGAENIIEHKATLLESPPDILLTNFKMLDYALMRNNYHSLWKDNLNDSSLFKFLVLDELHTYDGAQGSDVANLIRRLKLKINIPDGYLCPVGTSATMGTGADSKKLLTEYASKIFEEAFDETAIIEEQRVSDKIFFSEYSITNDFFPTTTEIGKSILNPEDEMASYIKKQLRLWKINESIEVYELGDKLMELVFFREFISILGKGIISIDELSSRIALTNKSFSELPEGADKTQINYRVEIINSIITLISHAKIKEWKYLFPFLYLQVQLWIRGLNHVSRLVQETPCFVWNNDASEFKGTIPLPPYFCRECGGSGWYAVKTERNEHLETDISDLYEKAMGKHKNVFFISPYSENALAEDYENAEITDEYLDPKTLGLYSKQKDSYIRILRCRKVKDTRIEEVCPHCNSRNTMTLLGTGVATMASISTGQTFASNLDDALEKDRKVLIFSNGVQDAAHHAGFIEARNYRFTFRTALQSVINTNETPISLKELYNQFSEYWKKNSDPENEKPLEAYLYKFFPADYIGKLKIDSFKTGLEKFRKNFVEEYDRRMEWEIWSEFGYNSTIGRTLEKTGVSVSFIDTERIRTVFQQMKFWLKDNKLDDITEEHFLKFVTGFLFRLRIRGGIDHVFLKKFRTEKSNYYLITQKPNPQHTFIKNFGKRTRLPKFITDDSSTIARNIFDVTNVRDNVKSNWYHDYFRKCFVIFSGGSDTEKLLINDFHEKLLDYLDNENIIDKKTAAGIKNYAINPAELKISNKVKQYQCSVCGHQVSDMDSQESVFNNLPCLQHHCSGQYHEFLNDDYNYYKTVYNRAHVMRIYSADHTGLLERKKREKIENDFKKRPNFNSVNLLVATSTLEMGIDVGDLNATFNSTLPPQPSNYLQRIGRAGRASGNALIVNFIGKGQHDQYYYQEPTEMMEGTIGTPGCFLEAKEIIRRHFIAYCFDSWATDDPKNHIIPRIIRDLKIDKITPDDPEFIINKLISFIRKANQDGKLFDKFKSKYQNFIDIKESIYNLEREVTSGEIIELLKKIYHKLYSEIDYYLKKKEKITETRDSLPVSDPERIEIEKDLKNLSGAIKLFRSRNFIECLTNIGILPNYAFPETGVALDAQIRERTGDSEGTSFINKSLEIIRPARTAIRELAPDNTFYSQGYKLNVSGIHIISRKDELLEYRYCSKCDNLKLNIESEKEPCPKCGDNSWRQATNVHNFVKMSSMVSYNDSSDSVILDETEERKPVRYSLSKHFRFDNSSSQGAHVLKQIPFGIEYVKNIVLMEVNTGKVDGFFDRSRSTHINDQEHSDYGFIVCRSCGKVSTRISNNHTDNNYHYQYCKNKETLYTGASDETFDEFYLFRELQSEAIKILLPVQEIDSEANVKLFKAGLFLGLKKYYKGNPQHLELHEYSEQNKHTGKKDRYLIMLESIPGGTGYLSKLFNVADFSELLKLAYESIRDCNCQHKEKDGCYHCIYTYSNQGDRDILSRKSAELVFEKIFNKTNEWVYLEDGLNDVTNSGNIEESELEERFPKILNDFANDTINKELGYRFSRLKVDDITNYQFKVVNKLDTIIYQITPQVRLDRRDGVQYGTVADFMIRCVDYKVNGESNISKIDSIKPIAIYLDGYAFHASFENNRFVSDFMKRHSIRNSEKFISWTLTWDDLTRFEKKESDYITTQSNNSVITGLRKINHPFLSKGTDRILKSRNNLDRLITFLEAPFYEDFSDNIKLFLFTLQEQLLGKEVKKEDVEDLCKNDPSLLLTYKFGKQNPAMLAYLDKAKSNDICNCILFQNPTDLCLDGCLILDEKNSKGTLVKEDWENFWHYFNLLQFIQSVEFRLPGEEIITKIIDDDLLLNDKLLENFDSKYHPLVNRLIELNIDFNKTETFVLESNGEIIAEAELGIESKKLVFGAFAGCKETFEKQGYTVNEIELFNIETI